MRPKTNLKNIPERDRCQTPGYALDPLIPYLLDGITVWEPACGEGYLVRELEQSGRKVIATDLLHGEDYFQHDPGHYDVQITNPPYSIKYEWLERAYRNEKPFALLLPIDTLGSGTAQKLFKRYGLELLLLNTRVAFKMPNTGWDSSPTFAVAWFTNWLQLGSQIQYGVIVRRDEQQGVLLDEHYRYQGPEQGELWND